VGQSRLPDTWISLQDFYTRSPSQKRAVQPDPSEPGVDQPPPSVDWIDASDYFIRGVRVEKPPIATDQFVVTMKEAAPEEPLPPEAGLTIYDAMKQIHSVYGPKNSIFSRLRQLEQQDRRELNSGRIDDKEFERRAVASAIIRENHGRRMEEITKWYMENYFRIFDNPEPDPTADGKKH